MKIKKKTWEPLKFNKDGMTKWHWKCQYHENFKCGKYVDISSFVFINAKYGVEMEEGVQVGPHAAILSASTIDDKHGKVVIKKNACIGSHAVIMPNVHIGKNSIIGACSFVNKDIPDNVIACGVPVRIIKRIKK